MNGTEEPTPDQPSAEALVAELGKRWDEEREERLKSAGFGSLDDLFEAVGTEAREKALPTPSWADLEGALTTLAAEDHIARRLETLRAQAGLSQEGLARRLEALGVQMPQSSISKIEGPMKTGKGKRRDITVDEAVALAKALDVPLTELLLPDNALADLRLHRILADGARLWSERNSAQLDYDYAVRQLAAAASDDSWRGHLENELQRIKLMETGGVDEQGRVRTDIPVIMPSDIARKLFLEDVLAVVDEVEQGGTEDQA